MRSKLQKIYHFRLFVWMLSMFIFHFSCKKFTEVEAPVTSVNAGNVFNDDANAIAAVTGIYAKMANNGLSKDFSVFPELSADNLKLEYTGDIVFSAYYQNILTAKAAPHFWEQLYGYIYTTNAAVEGLSNATQLTPAIKKRLLGEAYFTRAFCYFYLVSYYGNVPLALSTDYKVNSKLPRNGSDAVYQQIISDLNEAKALLDDQYLGADLIKTTQERVRPNRMAVYALLARVLLNTKDYLGAEAAATQVISKTDLFSSSIPLTSVFLKNSKETIWAFQVVKNNENTEEGDFYFLGQSGPDSGHPASVSTGLLNSFDNGDLRKESWINNVVFNSVDYPCIAKYKVLIGNSDVTEYPIILRIGEQYLIRSEARNNQGNSAGAVNDLNVLRSRSRASPTALIPDPLPNLSASLTQAELRPLILKERRVELFGEWGQRWFDLRRTGNIDAVLTAAQAYKGGTWSPYKALYPIPVNEILLNPALIQNPGYTN